MDTEFQVRLALAGELPFLVPKELARSVLHPDCKSIKAEHMQLHEQSFFLDLFWDQLSVEERLRGRIALCFRDSGVAAKLGKTPAIQYFLYLKGLIKAFGISPSLAYKRLVETLKRRMGGGLSTPPLHRPR